MYLAELTLTLKNIIHNAVKYSYTPVTTEHSKHRYVRIYCAWHNQTQEIYRVSIENYGVGITKKEIDDRLIFRQFYRGEMASDRQRTGSGIGLAYADYVVSKLHHGRIEVSSTPMGGEAYLTVFHVILPISQPKS